MLTNEQLKAIRTRENAATPGNWQWNINTSLKQIRLDNGRCVVMGFLRYGTDSAAPAFLIDGLIKRADKFAKSIPGLEHHIGYDDYIDHPDAEFIAHARQDIPALLEHIAKLNEWINDLQSGMYVNCVYCGHRYGHESDTPVSMADVLKEHVENCPQHPMAALKTEHDKWKRRAEELERLVKILDPQGLPEEAKTGDKEAENRGI